MLPLQLARKLKSVVTIGIVATMILAGCSNPLSDENDEPDDAAEAEITPTPASPMPIITPTPVDPTVVAAATPTPATEERPETYIVAEGDTLYAIAARFDVEISTLVAENGLSDPNDIWVGQELTIPPLE